MTASTHRILRAPDVREKTGLSRTTLLKMVREGSFPSPVKLGSSRTVGWVEAEVDSWIETQIALRPSSNAAANKGSSNARPK